MKIEVWVVEVIDAGGNTTFRGIYHDEKLARSTADKMGSEGHAHVWNMMAKS